MTDDDSFNEACGHAHFFNTSTAQESWTWTMENASCGSNSSGAVAWAIKPAAGVVTPPQVFVIHP
jgi:hypothetical protein